MRLEVEVERLDARTQRHRLREGGAPLTFARVLERWTDEPAFAAAFAAHLAAAPFEACFWELPALEAATLERPYEHVLVESSRLATVTADRAPFAAHFTPGAAVACFDSLRGDAHLVAPCPRAPDAVYPHLLAFVRTAPTSQISALFAAVGRATVSRLDGAPRWISTSGLGVYWLHVRLDTRPKYYTHEPYRSAPRP